jgi:hypothetical protein
LETPKNAASKQKPVLHLAKACFTVRKFNRLLTSGRTPMSDEQYHDLLGRIQGLSDIVVCLVTALDQAGAISMSDFAADMRRLAIIRDPPPELKESIQAQIDQVAEQLVTLTWIQGGNSL